MLLLQKAALHSLLPSRAALHNLLPSQRQMRDLMDEKKQALLCIMQSEVILARARLILQTCAVPLISHIPISAEQPVAES